MKPKGMVYLVGAGPGDPGLLTLRASELLGRADVVVCDDSVDGESLRRAPREAEVILWRENNEGQAAVPDKLSEILISRAHAGKTVVRLIAGDPYLFGGGANEAERLAEARIPFEVVPGVSPLVAAPNYAGIPPTHRGFASQLTLIGGNQDSTPGISLKDWEQVARAPGTKVIRLDSDRFAEIVDRLVKDGLPAETPVTVIASGTTSRQQSIEGTLGTIASTAAREKLRSPAVAIIGEVVKLRGKLNWFERRPLFGRRIVVTRSREQAGQLSRQLHEKGAEVLEVPTIKFEPPSRREDLVDALLELNSYDWLVFTSPNGVTTFFEYFFRRFHDMRDIGGARIAAVGPATANKLKELHLQVDLVPDEALAVKIAEAFAKFETIENLKICLLRAEVSNAELPEALEALGAIVDDVACYKTVPETEDASGAAASLEETGADWVAFTSGSTVEHFHARFDLPALAKKFPRLRMATIGPETSKALCALGLAPAVEAKHHTIDGLVEALAGACGKA